MTNTFHAISPPLHADPDGTIRIADSRVTLDVVLELYNLGHSAEQIAAEFPPLTLHAVYSTITYYLEEKAALDEYLKHRKFQAAELKQRILAAQPGQLGLRERLLSRLSSRN